MKLWMSNAGPRILRADKTCGSRTSLESLRTGVERLRQFQGRVQLTLHGGSLSLLAERAAAEEPSEEHVQLIAQLRGVLGHRFMQRAPPGPLQ